MRAIRICFFMLTVLLLAVSTASCAAVEPFDAGEPLSASDVAALRQSLLGEQNSTPEGTHTPEQPSNPVDTVTQSIAVFWLPSGSVYHTNSDCHHIKGKTNVQSGTVSAATEAGKTRACSSCAAD
ncbi:MAG: hypothetical protein IKM42_03935 [Clostridia bacterium]|nr:hypothetical protein [Clostridia bacterium]MBR3862789.1 hypothetical protein [Clostridia bacterium]